MTHSTSQADLALAVLEGVSFALADGLDAQHSVSSVPNEISLIGGGAKSRFWRQMLADIFGVTLVYRSGGDVGPALGAARLARLGTKAGVTVKDVCPVPDLVETHLPDESKKEHYQAKRIAFQSLYRQIKDLF